MNFEEVNKCISDKLELGKPFSLVRIDNSAGYLINCLFKKTKPSEEFFNEMGLLQGGIYPNSCEYYLDEILPRMLKIMYKTDILGVVDVAGEIESGDFFENFPSVPFKFAGKYGHYILDPGALLGHSHLNKLDSPWTKNLKNKKVLVISTHKESILSQWDKIDKIWGTNREVIAPFDLIDVIRSPYHPLMDNRQPPDCEHWLQSVEYIKKEIDNYDYDVLLSGSSSSSPFYVHHAKENGKIGIQLGGVHQLFFGITGYRWKQGTYSPWKNMYNEHWIHPFKEDEAQKRRQLLQLETNFAYW